MHEVNSPCAFRIRYILEQSNDDSLFCSIPQAIAIAKKMGMNVTQKESYIIPKRDLDPKERFLTPNEVETAMKKARDRGLPEGWTVECKSLHFDAQERL